MQENRKKLNRQPIQGKLELAQELPATKLVHGSAFVSRLSELQKAFALSYKFSQIASTNEERARHRAVAHLIWKSCGGAK